MVQLGHDLRRYTSEPPLYIMQLAREPNLYFSLKKSWNLGSIFTNRTVVLELKVSYLASDIFLVINYN